MRLVDGQVRIAASDVANFLACRHLTRLDLLRSRGVIEPPYYNDAGFEDLVRRGEEHERRVLDGFRARGLRVEETPDAAAAIASWADVIYQPVLERAPAAAGEPALYGRPDFLVRAGVLPGGDGGEPGGYEVVDAKLARSAKGRAVAQTAFYSALLAGVQGGVAPRRLHLALGDGEMTSFRVADFAAFERQTRRLLAEFIAGDTGADPPPDTYPEPVEHCAICRWSPMCAARRRDDDDLSLVAGMGRDQRRALKESGVATRRALAALPEVPVLRGVSADSLDKARSQARLQVASEDSGVIGYELLAPDRDADGELIPNRGLLALPPPDAGDLFFDIEGARFYADPQSGPGAGSEYGLQYLFGIVDTAQRDEQGRPAYLQFWAHDRAGEKRAFEELVDFVMARRAEHPGLHVYHYNHYEPTAVDHLSELHQTRQEAVGYLMGRYATREDEVDSLFRLGVFVDLYRVVRQGLRAGVESYSIKRLEPLCGYARAVGLRDATSALVSLEAALEDGSAAGDTALQQVVAGYNEDDCRATLALRDWLESLRAGLAPLAGLALTELPRPVVVEPERSPEDPEVTRLRASLQAAGDPASGLLADVLDWHRREDKPAWWRYFHVRTLSSADLVSEPDALGLLSGGAVAGEVARSKLWELSFPPQEHSFSPGDTAHDPVSDRGFTVHAVDDARGVITLRIGRNFGGPLPTALVAGGPVNTRLLAERLRDLGTRVAAGGLTGTDAATALLLRRPPAGQVAGPGGSPAQPLELRRAGESAAQAAVRVATALSDSYLPIQGPPGTGKTHTGAEQVLDLLDLGRSVGITGPSHAVIANFIGKVLERAAVRGRTVRVGQRAGKANPHLHPGAQSLDYPKLLDGLRDHDLDVAAGTAWMWARPEFQGVADTLFIDEAGQLSLADVLAVAGAARNLILLGDPQQLARPSQAAHPPGAGVSALEHVLDGQATMPPGAGLLIDKTWRMHPALCAFTSQTFYDGKLTWVDGLERQEVLGDRGTLPGAGLHVVEVAHSGNTSSSAQEAAVVAGLVTSLLRMSWRDRSGNVAPIGTRDIVVVTPFNAQIRAIRSAAVAAGVQVGGASGLLVGTVDKFQGREAPVVIYSMASSSADDAPRGMEFLYDLHRLNVATSRARALAVIVASPDLVRVQAQTPHQMHLASALCQARDAST